ncbi:MAG: DUF6249 domain-containing protein [Gammaproteobacteria bacterium]
METESIAVLIPIAGIIFGIGIAAVAIVTTHREKVKRAELRHKERLAALEKGVELPPEIVDKDEDGRPRFLLQGLVWLGVGVGIFFALGALAGERVGMLGLIPAAVGIATLIYYAIEGRKEKNGGHPPAA